MIGRVAGTERASLALVLRSSPMGEADAMVTLLTDDRGLIDAHAPSARRPAKTKRLFLEPMHTIRVTLLDRPGRDLPAVRQAVVVTPRTAILGSLPALEAAGQLLRWARSGLPKNQVEPMVWQLMLVGLDALGAHAAATKPTFAAPVGAPVSPSRGAEPVGDPTNEDTLPIVPTPAAAAPSTRVSDHTGSEAIIAQVGLRLLSALGYDLELMQCVRCGRPCPPGRPAYLDPAAGGIRCVACGGGPLLVSAALRAQVLRAASSDTGAAASFAELPLDVAREVCRWLTMAFDAHAGASRFGKVRAR